MQRLLPFTLIAAAGCAPQPEGEAEFETVELGAGPTANLRPDDDQAETMGAGGFAGQLPAGFPSDLPVPPSSSVLSATRGDVSFGTEDAADTARGELVLELSRAGWAEASETQFTKSGRTVRISVTPSDTRTRSAIPLLSRTITRPRALAIREYLYVPS